MRATVTCIKRNARESVFFVLGAENTLVHTAVESSGILNLGEIVELDEGSGKATQIEERNEAFERKLSSSANEFIKGQVGEKTHKSGLAQLDKITNAMWPRLCTAAELLLRKLFYSAPIIIRFHNDIDGSSGAFSLHKAIKDFEKGQTANVVWRMHRGIAYTREDAENDTLILNNYESVEKPLLFIIDFGTSKDSNLGVEAARGKFDMIWLDHHPTVEDFEGKELENYINPWSFGGSSDYTAGFLTCAFAHTFSEIETGEMEQVSLIGDYSKYAAPTEGSREVALLLDLATSNTKIAGSSNENLTPDMIESLLADGKKRKEMAAYAENKVAELLDIAVSSVKVHKAERAKIYVVDFGKIRGEDHEKYPLPGRFASRLLDKVEELSKEACVVIVHVGPYISIRTSKKIDSNLNIIEAIESLKVDNAKYIEAGGGHANAASIKLRSEEGKSTVIKALVEKLKGDISQP